MKLLIQPGDSVGPLIKAIEKAKKSVEIVIFRFDRLEIERALKNAAKRGIFVHALIAYTNRGGEKNLRKLEMRFLAAGITVARTADDLVRYHGKMMLIDRKQLYLLAFNFTHLDIERSRSFAIVTSRPRLVQEAAKLFEADTKRQAYTPGYDKFLVSPLNARKELAKFLKSARKELLIYDLKVSDRMMTEILEARAEAGVKIRVIGSVGVKNGALQTRKLSGMRQHTRTIIRDRTQMFLGSQSLRSLELDDRREIGIIVNDAKIISGVIKVFEQDWKAAAPKKGSEKDAFSPTVAKAAKKAAKNIARNLPPVGPVVEQAIKEVTQNKADVDLDHKEVDEAVKGAVKDAVKEALREVMQEATDRGEP